MLQKHKIHTICCLEFIIKLADIYTLNYCTSKYKDNFSLLTLSVQLA